MPDARGIYVNDVGPGGDLNATLVFKIPGNKGAVTLFLKPPDQVAVQGVY